MSDAKLQKWNQRYQDAVAQIPAASEVLAQNQHLLPAQGKALDLASGFAGNGALLAKSGLETTAWDFSPVVIEKLNDLIARKGLSLNAQARDVVNNPPEPQSFDVIVVSRFLERKLTRTLIDALRPDGLLFYQTFVKAKVNDSGPDDARFLLDENELLQMFVPPLTLRVYREEGRLGDTSQGFRNNAILVAQKR